MVNRAVASYNNLKRDATGDKYITKGQVNSNCVLFNVIVKTTNSLLSGCLCGCHRSNTTLVKDCSGPHTAVMSSGFHLSILSSAFSTRIVVNCEMVWIRQALGGGFSPHLPSSCLCAF